MKQRSLRLVMLFLLLSPVLASAASPTVSPSDRLEDQGTLDLHVTWNGIPVAVAPVYLYSETGTYLDRFMKTDAGGHVQFTVPTTPCNFKVKYRGKEYWTGNLFAIVLQKLEVEVPLEQLADISTNNPNAARYDGEPPVFNHEPIQVASLGTYIGILSQAAVAQVQPQPKVYYFITDHLGTPMKMTNEAGGVVWSADYRPFGEVSSGVSTIQNHFRFPGQYYEKETGLHYNYHRYYQPKMGRYATPDPIGLSAGINPYLYVRGNAMNATDPFGLWSPKAHDALIQNAFQGILPQQEIDRLKSVGRAFDKSTQSASQSHLHSMRQADQSMADAIYARDKFVDDMIKNMGCEQDRDKELEILGELIHPIMDQYSPEHTDSEGNPRIWNPLWPFGHSPNEFIGNETVKDITPEIYQKTKDAMLNAYFRAVGLK